MSTKQTQTANHQSTSTAAPVSPALGTQTASQRTGNAAAQERTGLSGSDAGRFGGDISEVVAWMWGQAKDTLGLDDGETEDGLALAKQTAGNVHSAHEKLGELSEKARLLGLDDIAARLDGAAGRLSKAGGFAEELSGLIEKGENLALVKRLYDTTSAVMAVDMRAPEAAATFDAWFAAMGATGGFLADRGGAWGTVLQPFATFIKMLGEANFFMRVRDDMQMHGSRGANGATLRELKREGF
jgi:hypothetical protein